MLILFDIDLTLLSSFGCGMQAMEDAGREMFGPDFSGEGVQYAGRLDPLIIDDLLAMNGAQPGASQRDAYAATYAYHLERSLAERGGIDALPGAQELVGALLQREGATIGLLTGNFEKTGSMKLRAAGIQPEDFSVQVWGSDSPHEPPSRDHLPPVACRRYAELHGAEIAPEHVVIIGDTPWDVQCARVNGCLALGVATGHYDAEQLAKAGANRVVADLSDTQELLRWMNMTAAM